MLNNIRETVARYTKVIATVTNINVEVVDAGLVRVAGTGMYASGVGKSIKHAGEVYRHVLRGEETFVMHNPREHDLCKKCNNLNQCREMFSLCTPITYNTRTIGIIGIVCFTEAERTRILSNLAIFRDFVEQMASAISVFVGKDEKIQQTQHLLDMFLHITDTDHRGILIFNSAGAISYLNDMARHELALDDKSPLHDIQVRATGNTFSNMEEFEVSINGKQITLLGRLSDLGSDDAAFHSALVFDTLPKYTKMLSQATLSPETVGLRSIIGESQCITELKQRVQQIAKTSSTVLITGESGTGKEMFARAIHAASNRRDKPFIPINCGAIPDSLLESELFGYVSGAFTGASPSGHIGKFELAHQGVLFLDEIGAMPLYLQVKLLRVLQDRRIMRLGSNRTIEIDVRIIAATNDNLLTLMEQGMFRDDLYYRLNVIPLHIPPLRERGDDIPHLASFFLEKYCQLFGKKLIRPTSRLLKELELYSWPGNVREFENIMEYLVNMIPGGGSATVGMLPTKIRAATKEKNTESQLVMELLPKASYPHSHSVSTAPEDLVTTQSEASAQIIPLAVLEREAIKKALASYGNDAEGKRRAADALGIGIATLYRKIKEMDG